MSQTETNPNAFKHLFGKELLDRMSKSLQKVYPKFDRKYFLSLSQKLEPLEMKPRVQYIREELRNLLPQNYSQALKILLKSTQEGKLESFDLWPYSDFIQTYGLEDLDLSLQALRKLTPLFSSEFAIRPFLKQHPKKTLQFLLECAKDENVHIRRWASEGTRPRLPWGERLHDFIQDPNLTLDILEELKFDSELYVRKSVSNHLNDITKDHPKRVIQLLTRWKKMGGSKNGKHVEWIAHRALRTLIKQGHPKALQFFGVSCDAKVKIKGFKLNQERFQEGERIDFEFKIHSLSDEPQNIVVDYIIHYMKANQTTSPKVFKLKKATLPSSGILHFTKSHHLKKVTTRVHYEGIHRIEIQVNGRILERSEFFLELAYKSAPKKPKQP
jgi:3-methyladenine DNA glycosylase AlkC